MTTYQPIKCTDYDQFEAYCITREKLKISLDNGQEIKGYAVDLKNIKNQGEFLVLAELKTESQSEVKAGKGEQRVRLDMIKKVTVI